MTTILIISIVIVIVVTVLTIVAISKGYAYEHQIDPLPNEGTSGGESQSINRQKKNEDS
ncbi:YtzI protein [Alkalibacillus silvisoli]|uniref:YtzI protein n=1 Tax=Alkalibacillus silvisoli TaxID=392823 RepID=A0ABN0ZN88_9BACI